MVIYGSVVCCDLLMRERSEQEETNYSLNETGIDTELQ
jgi:hypothetical protein